MLLRITIKEMKRILSSSGFWLSAGLLVILLLTGTAYKDQQDGTTYTVITAAFEMDTEELLRYSLDVQSLLYSRVYGSLPMYGMLLAALSFAGALCEEQKYGVRRYLVFKEGKVRYVLGKAFAAILASVMSFLVAAGIMLLFLFWKYPMMKESSISAWMEYYGTNGGVIVQALIENLGGYAHIVLTLVGGCVYMVFCAFLGFVCTAFFSNVYLAVCIPFFFGYIYYSIMDSMVGRVMEGAISWEFYSKLTSYVSPNGYMSFWSLPDSRTINMLVLLAVWVVAVGVHILRMHKAADCGVNA